jgi:pilus assembly protein Flp/PilA
MQGVHNDLNPHAGEPAGKAQPRLAEWPEDSSMKDLLKRFWQDESGQGLTEYALVLALISIGLIAVLIVFRDSIGRVFDRVVGVLDAAPEGGFQPGG